VDDPQRLLAIVSALREIAEERPVNVPDASAHRTALERASALLGRCSSQTTGYLEMLDLVDGAFAVVTDSGGLQEETTALGIPCRNGAREHRASYHDRRRTNRLVPDPRDLATTSAALKRVPLGRVPEGGTAERGERIVLRLVERSS